MAWVRKQLINLLLVNSLYLSVYLTLRLSCDYQKQSEATNDTNRLAVYRDTRLRQKDKTCTALETRRRKSRKVLCYPDRDFEPGPSVMVCAMCYHYTTITTSGIWPANTLQNPDCSVNENTSGVAHRVFESQPGQHRTFLDIHLLLTSAVQFPSFCLSFSLTVLFLSLSIGHCVSASLLYLPNMLGYGWVLGNFSVYIHSSFSVSDNGISILPHFPEWDRPICSTTFLNAAAFGDRASWKQSSLGRSLTWILEY